MRENTQTRISTKMYLSSLKKSRNFQNTVGPRYNEPSLQGNSRYKASVRKRLVRYRT